MENDTQKLLAIAASQTHALLALADTIESFIAPDTNAFRNQFTSCLRDRAAHNSAPADVARLLNELADQVNAE